MRAGTGYLQSPFRTPLPDYVGKVRYISARRALPQAACNPSAYKAVRAQLRICRKYPHGIVEGAGAIHLYSPGLTGLERRKPGQDYCAEPPLRGILGIYEGARHRPEAAVEPELAHKKALAYPRRRAFHCGREDSGCDREVVAAPVLAQVRRSKVYHYLPARDPVSERLHSRKHAQQAFLDRRIREAHEMYPYAVGDIRLDRNAYGIYSYTFGCIYTCKHSSFSYIWPYGHIYLWRLGNCK